MRVSSLAPVLVLTGMAGGCDPSVEPQGSQTQASATGGGSPGSVLLLLNADAQGPCDTVGVVEVQLVARQTGCESAPPAPCTMPSEPPSIDGDLFTCPTTDASRLLGVEVTEAGRYLVRSEVRDTTGQEMSRCHGVGGDPEVLVTTEEIQAGAVKMLDDDDLPCP